MSYGLLKGKRGIISGALDSNSIAWKVAQRAKQEGAIFTLTNAPIAMRLGEINTLAEECEAKIIPADATSVEDLEKLYTGSMEALGGKIDFTKNSIEYLYHRLYLVFLINKSNTQAYEKIIFNL